MTQKELAAYCPGIDQLEQTLLETLISIEDPNARLNAFYNVLTKREEKVGDMEEEFENFFLSPKGFVEQFIHLLDSTPSSPDRDRLIVSLMDLILERSLAMVYEVGGEERAKLLLSKIESETWRERGQALLIEFREQYNCYEAGSRILNNKQLVAIIQ